jgi:prepilin-type N-terminal cleavage/methylation domain-containing protein
MPLRGERGFTLIELLLVVLIVGLLASIAVPVFVGTRNKSKNAVAQTTLRTAMVAARTYYTGNENFTGLDTPTLATIEKSLSDLPPSVLAPGTNADPRRINVTVLGSGTGVRLCNASKGNASFCMTFDGQKMYYHVTSGTIAQTAATGGSSRDWASLYSSPNASNPLTYGSEGAPLGSDDVSGNSLLIEAESFMTIGSCGAFNGVVTQCSGGANNRSITLPTSMSYFRMRAGSTQCPPAGANVTVAVDGVQIATKTIALDNSSDLNWYGFTLSPAISAGTHTFTTNFTNDSYQPGICDRNMYFDRFDFFQNAP